MEKYVINNRKVCIHLWNLDPPSKMKSKGVCEKCGEEKVFSYSSYMENHRSYRERTKEDKKKRLEKRNTV